MKSDFRINGQRVNPVIGALFMVLFLVALFMLARFIFRILYFLSPIALIATLIIDYRVVVNYLKWLVTLVRGNTLLGAGAILLSVIGFPVVTAYLLVRAIFSRRVRQMEKEMETRRKGEYIEYEELDSEPLDLKELREEEPSRPQEKKKSSESDYDQYFE